MYLYFFTSHLWCLHFWSSGHLAATYARSHVAVWRLAQRHGGIRGCDSLRSEAWTRRSPPWFTSSSHTLIGWFTCWTRDSSSLRQVWWMDGFYKGRRVQEYRTMGDFTKGQNFVQHLLPHPWAGTGHVVYNGSLYYNKHQSNILVGGSLRRSR